MDGADLRSANLAACADWTAQRLFSAQMDHVDLTQGIIAQ